VVRGRGGRTAGERALRRKLLSVWPDAAPLLQRTTNTSRDVLHALDFHSRTPAGPARTRGPLSAANAVERSSSCWAGGRRPANPATTPILLMSTQCQPPPATDRKPRARERPRSTQERLAATCRNRLRRNRTDAYVEILPGPRASAKLQPDVTTSDGAFVEPVVATGGKWQMPWAEIEGEQAEIVAVRCDQLPRGS
jgi:hypothetical protein